MGFFLNKSADDQPDPNADLLCKQKHKVMNSLFRLFLV